CSTTARAERIFTTTATKASNRPSLGRERRNQAGTRTVGLGSPCPRPTVRVPFFPASDRTTILCCQNNPTARWPSRGGEQRTPLRARVPTGQRHGRCLSESLDTLPIPCGSLGIVLPAAQNLRVGDGRRVKVDGDPELATVSQLLATCGPHTPSTAERPA